MKGITTLEILIVVAIITVIALYIGIAYVGLHFITKFW
jgi:hypothetical protein